MVILKNLKFFFATLLLSLFFWWGINIFQKNLENFFYAQINKPLEEMIFIQSLQKPQKPTLRLNVRSALSLRIDRAGREKVLFQKNPEEILPIASLTKLMTALIVLKNYDLENNSIIISSKIAHQENVPNYGNLDKEIGKKITLKKLLELMLIYSSNDAAFGLSEVIGVEKFVGKMNQKAKELELKNTHFVNPTGLDPENLYYHPPSREYFNYSTTKDLIKLTQYILKEYPLIFEISLKKGSYPVKNGLYDLTLPENLRLLGGKTGYTSEAGECFLVLFQDEKGFIFFNLILGTEKGKRIEEMQKLIDWINL